jgi:hypothetical protein
MRQRLLDILFWSILGGAVGVALLIAWPVGRAVMSLRRGSPPSTLTDAG